MLALTVLGLCCVAAKPHLLMLVIDDLGHDDMGFLAQKPQIRTPISDRFAHEGKILTNYYVQPSCSPTRTTLFSGRYPLRTGVNNFIPVGAPYGLSRNETTLADMLGKAGYATHAVGKWHLGMYSYKMTPTFRGFDSFYGFYNGGEDYYTHVAGAGKKSGYDMRRDVRPQCGKGCSVVDYNAKGQYSTTLFTTEAVRIIDSHPTDRPLFLYLAYQAVHCPVEAPEQYVEPYKAMGLKYPRSTYAGMVACMDEGVGNVTGALQRRGMLDDTLIIFTADNGGPSETCCVQGSSNLPYRGSKCSLWEGGTRASSFVWTGKNLQHQIRPGHFDNLMHAADWMPTIAEATQTTCSTCLKWDGVSQWKQLTSQSTEPVRSEVYYGITDAQVGIHGPAIRQGCHKLILGDGGKPGGWVPPDRALAAMNEETSLFSHKKCIPPRGGSPPLPPNPNNTMLLFDVCNDPGEHRELPLDNPGFKLIADKLHNRIVEIWSTGSPGCPDPSCEGWGGNSTCGTGVPVNINGVMTWEPWCD